MKTHELSRALLEIMQIRHSEYILFYTIYCIHNYGTSACFCWDNETICKKLNFEEDELIASLEALKELNLIKETIFKHKNREIRLLIPINDEGLIKYTEFYRKYVNKEEEA